MATLGGHKINGQKLLAFLYGRSKKNKNFFKQYYFKKPNKKKDKKKELRGRETPVYGTVMTQLYICPTSLEYIPASVRPAVNYGFGVKRMCC